MTTSRTLLYLSWILAFLIVGIMTLNGKQESTQFQGIADTREVIINSQSAVEIKNIHVVPGQIIKTGKLLVELNRPELTLKINDISHQLEKLKVEKRVQAGKTRAQINELNAQKALAMSEIDSKIEALKTRHNLNKKLTSQLKSIKPAKKKAKTAMPGQIAVNIAGLLTERKLAQNRINLKVDALNAAIESPENPLNVKIESLEKELHLLNEQKKELLIYSQMNGIIGSIHCKRGEKISPFAPVLTLYSRSPSYVRGYIHEKVHNRAQAGELVKVVSLTSKNTAATGTIVGVGSRIVDYPIRLRKRPDLQAWGREVQIKIPEENRFLLGEKVMICPVSSRQNTLMATIRKYLNFGTIQTADARNSAADQPPDLTDIKRHKSLVGEQQIEASGMVWLYDLSLYLVISDDTPDRKPVLYLMDEKGTVRFDAAVQGLDTINDMEAVCLDSENRIYIAASQGYDRDDTLTDDRKRLVRILRTGTQFVLDKQVLLYDLLAGAAASQGDAPWAQFVQSGIKSGRMEIEGMFFDRGSLFLGFKTPLRDGRAVILKIEDIDRVLMTNRLDKNQVSIWKALDLTDPVSEIASGISDMYRHGKKLIILSVAKTGKKRKDLKRAGLKRSANVWVHDTETDTTTTIRNFRNLRPEGIAFDSDSGVFLLAFDEGAHRPSKIMKLDGIK